MKYDAIIVGGSFAGLAVASELNGNILLIDRKKIGIGQTSACGTRYDLAKEISKRSILQKFDTLTINTLNKEIVINLKYPYCTIDYGIFCKDFFKKVDVEFKLANVKSYNKNDGVITDKGNFKSDLIIDCSGWSAVIASSIKKDFVNKKMLGFGVETEVNYKDNTLRFFADTNIIEKGAAWIFPIGKKSRFGIASYIGKTKLIYKLKKFLDSYNLTLGKSNLHGGYFPCGLRKPVIKDIFLVGDSAGQTIPLSGEGIKPSIEYGKECGKIIQEIIDKKIGLKQGLKKYYKGGMKHKKYRNMLLTSQNLFIRWNNSTIEKMASMLENRIFVRVLEEKYRKL